MKPLKRLEGRIHGWLPKELASQTPQKSNIDPPTRIKTEMERKASKAASVANAIMVAVFLGAHALIDPFNRSTE